jgi:hypothetical protein
VWHRRDASSVPHPHLRLAAPFAAALGALACSKHEPAAVVPAPLPLDQRLDPGEVRAGLISKSSELLTGTKARGRIGDVKLYNARIAVVISQPGDARGYNPYGGQIVDADRVRADGEPGQALYGEVMVGVFQYLLHADTVEVVNDGRDGKPAVVHVAGHEDVMPLLDTLITALSGGEQFLPVDYDVDYTLAADADAVQIDYKLRNHDKETIDVPASIVAFVFNDGPRPFVPGYGFALPGIGAHIDYYAAVAEKVSYLYWTGGPLSGLLSNSGILATTSGDGYSLLGHQSRIQTHHLVIGDGDLSKTQDLLRAISGQAAPAQISGTVLDGAGAPVAGARVHVLDATPIAPDRDYVTQTRTGADGKYALAVAAGSYQLVTVADGHAPSAPQPADLTTATQLTVDVALDQPGTVNYKVADETGQLIPAKLMLVSDSGSTDLPSRFGEADRPGGVAHVEYGIHGQGSFEMPAGSYQLTISRGSEYEIDQRTITLPPAGAVSIDSALMRSVDTRGWMSTDTHIHAQMSPDSSDLYPFKVSAMVVEGLEMPISTEHEAIGDFNPAIAALGLGDWIQGVVGTEITTYVYGHFNAYPLVADPTKPGNGMFAWYHLKPAETFALVRARPGDAFLQVNHPRSAAIGGYFEAYGYDPQSFSSPRGAEFSTDFDGIEIANGCDLARIEGKTVPDWFAFLNHSQGKFATGSTDSHHAGSGEMGYPRTYVRMPTDDPKSGSVEDLRKAMKAGRMIVTCGPFLSMTIGEAEIGDLVKLDGDLLQIQARVAAPSWMDLTALEVVVNGAQVKSLPITSAAGAMGDRFSATVTASVASGVDAWVVLRVRGAAASPIHTGYAPSWAITNPIFIDGDGNGRWQMP